MSEIHINNETDRKMKIPLRNEMDDNDEKSKCFGHFHHSDQRKQRGLLNKILYRIAECIEIHVEVNNKLLDDQALIFFNCVDDLFCSMIRCKRFARDLQDFARL